MRRWIPNSLLLTLSLTALSPLQATPFPEIKGRDISPQYFELAPRVDQEFLKVLPRLQKYKIIYVPGLFSNLIHDASRWLPMERKTLLSEYTTTTTRFTSKPSLFETYRLLKQLSAEERAQKNNLAKPFLSWLKNFHIDFERLPINSQGGYSENSKIIREALSQSEKPVILITRSKGGNDALHAYLNDPSLFTKRVYGWITIQTPVFGSPVADIFTENYFLRQIAKTFFEAFGGGIEALEQVSLKKSRRFHQLYGRELQRLLKRRDTSFLSVGSFIDDDRKRWDTIFEPVFRDYVQWQFELDNDGVVPWKSTVLPGTDYVILPDTDHMVTTSGSLGPIQFDSKRFAHTLLTLLAHELKHTEKLRF